jgi:RNA polymerase sigma-70 factor, ECF subfamily
VEGATAVDVSPNRQKAYPDEVARWIRQARTGDSLAFKQLVYHYQRQVLRTTHQLLGKMDLAQDAAQEVFLRLFRSLSRIRDEQEISPWLYRVTVNVCRGLWRKTQPASFLSFESLREDNHWDPPAGDASLEERMLAVERRRMAGEAIAQLPPREREALVLRDLEGLTTNEVARILQISEATVRVQISSARLKIRESLGRKLGGRQ